MNTTKRIYFIYWTIGILVFLYVFIRAILVGVTYDEAWTITQFVPSKLSDIICFTVPIANNHIVNTLLIKFLFLFGNESVFIARLPNVLALILFIYFSARITREYIGGWIGLGTFLLVLANPFVLDFFGLARGYGLSLSFQVAAIYYFIRFFNSPKRKTVFSTLIFAALSVLSNFTLLNFFLAIVLLLYFVPLVTKRFDLLKKIWIPSLVISLIVVAIIYEPLRKLKASGNLYYGGNHDFYTDTLQSLSKYTLYTMEQTLASTVALNIFLILLVGFLIVSYTTSKFRIDTPKNLIGMLFFACFASTVLQHYLFDNLYLVDRTALLFIPLLLFLFGFSIQESLKYRISKWAMSMVVLGFSLNFLQQANFYRTVTWYFEANALTILETVNNIGEKQSRKVRFDFGWPFRSSFSYYLERKEYPYIQSVYGSTEAGYAKDSVEYYVYLNSFIDNIDYVKEKDLILKQKKEKILTLQEGKVHLYKIVKE